MKTVLENLRFLIELDNGLAETLNTYTLFGIDGPIEGCQRTIADIQALFPSRPIGNSKAKAALAALAWPFKEAKAKQLLAKMMQLKTTISLVLTTDSR
jgi:hypothetical protein